MKLLHLADLHIGKKLFDVSLKEDQDQILSEILTVIETEQPDAILICGDIYDKAQASAEAIASFDRFLTALNSFTAEVLIIAGNHDSPARLSYVSSLLKNLRIHMTGELSGYPEVVTLADAFGPVHFVLLPFFRLYEVRALFPDAAEELKSYNDALQFLLAGLDLPAAERCVLLSHQHYSNPEDPALVSDSELDIVGGLEALNSALIEPFTYAALGHLHRPQKIYYPHVRYAGSPLAYSFSEADQKKSLPIIELGEPGAPAEIRFHDLTPLRRVSERKGKLAELIDEARALAEADRQDFLRITLTDEERVENPMQRLKAWYPNVLSLRIEREDLARIQRLGTAERALDGKTDTDLFTEFYLEQRGVEMSAADRAKIENLWHQLQAEIAEEDRR